MLKGPSQVRSDQIASGAPVLRRQAGVPSFNELAVGAVALKTWQAFHNQDGLMDGSPLGNVLFPPTIVTRTTWSATAGEVPSNLPYAAESLAHYINALWNFSPALREATTRRAALHIPDAQTDIPNNVQDTFIVGKVGVRASLMDRLCGRFLSSADKGHDRKASKLVCMIVDACDGKCHEAKFGFGGSGTPTHLSDQCYSMCWRQEENTCAICWIPVVLGSETVTGSFGLSVSAGNNNARGESDGKCRGDFLQIPDAQVDILSSTVDTFTIGSIGSNINLRDRVCGRFFSTAASGADRRASRSICTQQRPFRMTFKTDENERTFEAGSNNANVNELNRVPGGIVGFNLEWNLQPCP
eukprot:maker-scaffold326_size205590-snap-gene-0.13 protein:Tk02472 transcript:maker-scaffold326_size205590-snap-gene-0.13-mRNA-1 annotation:"hypothetical protein DAPPUDRAFT_101194"